MHYNSSHKTPFFRFGVLNLPFFKQSIYFKQHLHCYEVASTVRQLAYFVFDKTLPKCAHIVKKNLSRDILIAAQLNEKYVSSGNKFLWLIFFRPFFPNSTKEALWFTFLHVDKLIKLRIKTIELSTTKKKF